MAFAKVISLFCPSKPLISNCCRRECEQLKHDMGYLLFYLQCEPRQVGAVDKQITDSTYVCLPHLSSIKLYSLVLGPQTFCAQVLGRPGPGNESQALFLENTGLSKPKLTANIWPSEFCDVIYKVRIFVWWAAFMMSSKQLCPVGPRNAKVAWKKRASQTPKAKAAPCPGDDRPDAVPKAKSKAHKNIGKNRSS